MIKRTSKFFPSILQRQFHDALIRKLQNRNLIERYSLAPLNIDVKNNNLSAYMGIDPTSPFLHIGHLLGLITLNYLHKEGINPILLIGNATAIIGDPSFREEDRPKLLEEEINNNFKQINSDIQDIYQNISRCFGNNQNNNKSLNMVENFSFYQKINIIDFINNVARAFKVSSIINNKSMSLKMKTLTGSDFLYPMFQSFDYYCLFQKFNCRIQIGGSDQWGNILHGIEFIYQKEKENVAGFTFPLLVDSGGQKLSKSKKNAYPLSKKGTTPFLIYQHFLNWSDDNMSRHLKTLTFYEEEYINEIMASPKSVRLPQKKLAEAITTYVFGDCKEALFTTDILFHIPLDVLLKKPESELNDLLQKCSKIKISEAQLNNMNIIELVMHSLVYNESIEIRDAIKEGILSINGIKIAQSSTIKSINPLCGQFYIIKSGKKKIGIVMKCSNEKLI